MPKSIHVPAIWSNEIARSMSVIDFCLSFGDTIALAIMGAVFNDRLVGILPNGEAPIHINNRDQGSLDAISALGPQIQNAFRGTARTAVYWLLWRSC